MFLQHLLPQFQFLSPICSRAIISCGQGSPLPRDGAGHSWAALADSHHEKGQQPKKFKTHHRSRTEMSQPSSGCHRQPQLLRALGLSPAAGLPLEWIHMAGTKGNSRTQLACMATEPTGGLQPRWEKLLWQAEGKRLERAVLLLQVPCPKSHTSLKNRGIKTQ